LGGMDEPAIRFERVTKIYQSRQVALADVSFEIPQGATVGLLGANGAGKSTAIRIALGLLRASAGDVEVFGERMHPRRKALRQRLGFLSDDPAFPMDRTAIAYLHFVGECFGLARRDLKARVGTLLRAVGLTNDAGRKIATYSTGMKTRLGIAASLMNDPEILVWDEPTAGLDPISRRQTLELLERFRGRKTVLLSSHILGDIDRVCDRLVVLNEGQLLYEGTRERLEAMTSESVLELRVSGPAQGFREAAEERLGRPDLCREGGRLRFGLEADERVGEMTSALLAIAAESGVEVTGINSTGRRLEDAYLQLISEDEFRGLLRASA
jgi:ABC-2 type transport system ATP-binding protein